MSDIEEFDYGPPRTYEVTWRDRPPEMVQGHQVMFDSTGFSVFGPPPAGAPKFRIHGMFPGRHWRMVLMGQEADVIMIRDVTEYVADLESMAAEDP